MNKNEEFLPNVPDGTTDGGNSKGHHHRIFSLKNENLIQERGNVTFSKNMRICASHHPS